MTSEFKPLIDDTNKPAYIRDLLRQARSANTPPYDFDAGLAKHKTLIASSAPVPKWANSSLTGVTKTTTLIARIVGIASVPVVGGIIAWNVWNPSDGNYVSYNTNPIQAEHKVEQPSKAPEPEATRVTMAQVEQVGATNDIESQSTPSTRKPKGETTKRKESVASPRRKPLYRRSPSEAVAQPLIALAEVADEEVNDQLSTGDSDDNEIASDQSITEPVASSTFEKEPKAKSTGSSDDTLQREIKLLAEARRLVSVSPLRSIALARARNPKTGILNEEWDQINLLALIKLGRIEEAKKGVIRFRNRYPNSAFNERLRKELLPPR